MAMRGADAVAGAVLSWVALLTAMSLFAFGVSDLRAGVPLLSQPSSLYPGPTLVLSGLVLGAVGFAVGWGRGRPGHAIRRVFRGARVLNWILFVLSPILAQNPLWVLIGIHWLALDPLLATQKGEHGRRRWWSAAFLLLGCLVLAATVPLLLNLPRSVSGLTDLARHPGGWHLREILVLARAALSCGLAAACYGRHHGGPLRGTVLVLCGLGGVDVALTLGGGSLSLWRCVLDADGCPQGPELFRAGFESLTLPLLTALITLRAVRTTSTCSPATVPGGGRSGGVR